MLKFYKTSILGVFLFLGGLNLNAQIKVIDHKGTLKDIDTSKWTLSGIDIYNKNTGNVGIGNNNPQTKLHTNGTLRFENLDSNDINFKILTTDLLGNVTTRSLNSLKTALPDSTTAQNGLIMNGNEIELGGTLNRATTITQAAAKDSLTFATAGNKLKITGLASGSTTDSIVVIDPTSGQLKRISSSRLATIGANGVSNGVSGDSILLGGTLNRATTITQTAAKDSLTFATGGNKLKITGLASGSTTDSIVVIDPTSGQLKRISSSRLATIGANGVSNGVSGDSILLGGTLNRATTITQTAAKDSLTFATGGNKLKITGLASGSTTDSIVVIDPTSGQLKRISSSRLATIGANGVSNGVSGDSILLGGTLNRATTITQTAAKDSLTFATGGNKLKITGLASGSTTDSIVVTDPTTGQLKRISSSRLATIGANGVSNGVSGDSILLGGTLNRATTITQTAAKDSLTFATGGNKLKITGLASGSTTDSIVVIDPTSGQLKRISSSRLATIGANGVSNGVSGDSILLGGTLNRATTITQVAAKDSLTFETGGNKLKITGLASGSTTDSIVVIDPTSGQLKRISSSKLATIGANGVSNGVSGDSILLGGTLNRATTITQTAAKDSLTFATGSNKLKITGLASGSTTDSIVVTDPTTGQLKRISSSRLATIGANGVSNGVSGDSILLGGTLNRATSISQIATKDSLTFATGGNKLKITGLASGSTTDSIVVTDPTTGQLKRISSSRLATIGANGVSNGVSGDSILLGGTLNRATTITQAAAKDSLTFATGGNKLKITGLASGSTTDSIVVTDPTTGQLKRISSSRLATIGANGVSNGVSGDSILLGGTLNRATTITQVAAKDSLTFATGGNKLKITGLASGSTTDSLVVIDPTTGQLKRISSSRLETKVIDVYSTGGVQAITAAVATLDLTTVRIDLGTAYTLAANQITVLQAGTYRITYNVGVNIAPTNELSSRFWLENNATEITNSNIIIHAYGGSTTCSSRSIIIQFSANDVIRIRMQRVNTTNMNTVPSCTGLNIEKLD